jgi:hypothetical protein
MIFFTSAWDLPQKEQSVMRDDLAMAGDYFGTGGGVEAVFGFDYIGTEQPALKPGDAKQL